MDQNQEREYRRAFVDAAAQAEAESGGRGSAVAVTLGGEDEDEANNTEGPRGSMSPEALESAVDQLQQWEAALVERSRMLEAAEAELAGQAQAVARWVEQVQQGGQGGQSEPDGREARRGHGDARRGGGLIEDVRAEAFALAQDRAQLEQVLAQMIEDYGREHVVVTLALSSPMVELMAEPYMTGVNQRIEALIEGVRDAFSRNHLATISDAHADFDEVTGSEAFIAWLAGLDEEDQAVALNVLENGTAGQVVKLLKFYKDAAQKRTAPSPEDVWAEDAAASVKGSAPLRLPESAPRGVREGVAAHDEYARAWAAL